MKFKSDIEVQSGLRDGGNDIGTAGQLLSSTGTVTNWIDQGDVVAAGATRVLIACKNTSGGTITKGTPVYQTGNVGATDVIEIAAADALISTGYLPAIGLLETDLINNAFGHVVITGELLNITTSPIDGVVPVTGDTVYLKSGGGLTLTKPTGEGNAIQNLGLVGKVSGGNAGSLTVASIMRQNDVPNLPEGRIWIGDGNTIVSDTVYVDEPNNRVGIGTTSPATKLHISDATTPEFRIQDTTNNRYLSLYQNNSNSYIQSSLNSALVLSTHGANERMRITTAGNVGIGTTSPDSKLNIEGPKNTAIITLGNTTAGSSWVVGDRVGGIDFYSGDGSGGGIGVKASISYEEATGGTGSSQAMVFRTGGNTSGTNNVERMRLQYNGNVGIGTTSPSANLEVQGTNSNTQAALKVTDSGDSFFEVVPDSNTTFKIGDLDAVGDEAMIVGTFSDITFSKGGTTTMILDSNNRVGIGTISPTAKLDVYGDLSLGTTGDFNITQSPFSTAVFYVAGGGNGGTITFGAPASNTQNVSVQGDLYSYQGSIGTQQFGSFNNKISYNGDNYLNSGNLGVGTTSPSEKLEVDGNVKASNYINQRVAWNSGFNHGSNNITSYYFIPVGYISETTADTYYNNWIAPYAGRVRKIVLRNTGQSTVPTATTVNFRVSVNGSVVHTGSTITVTGSGLNILASETLSDSAAVFNATDRVQVAYRTNGFWRNVAAGISLEYTE